MLGNKFVGKKMYLSAYDAYLAGLRRADLASTLLLNRSKALAMMGNWRDSLADAASSLTLQPKNTEAWSQYKISLDFVSKKIISQGKKHKQCVERQILHDVLAAEATDCSKKVVVQWIDKSSLELKDDGDLAFDSKQYNKASVLYSAALHKCGELPRALLANWSLCCLNIGAHLDALAASAASLRIHQDGKSVLRLARALLYLGEAELCRSVLNGKVPSNKYL